ncbi:MAG: sulfur carrier protein ThiS [Eubacterium sp.]|nr:sulfur carrier protein ThiS [Eubacterium sp.]
MIQINGENKTGYEGLSVAQMVEKEGYTIGRIALEINGTIISKNDYNDTVLHSGDVIEVVSFVGGG